MFSVGHNFLSVNYGGQLQLPNRGPNNGARFTFFGGAAQNLSKRNSMLHRSRKTKQQGEIRWEKNIFSVFLCVLQYILREIKFLINCGGSITIGSTKDSIF